MGLFSFHCKSCGDQEQFAATMNCIVCFEYSDWVKPLEEEFKNNACEILSLPAPPHVDDDEDKAEEGATFAPGLVSPEALQGRWVNAKGQSINIKTKPNNPWKPALECDFGKGAKAELRDERGGKFSFPRESCFGPKQRWELVTSESSPNKLVWALREVAAKSGADAIGSLIGEDKKLKRSAPRGSGRTPSTTSTSNSCASSPANILSARGTSRAWSEWPNWPP